MAISSKRSYGKKPAKLPSKTALTEVAQNAGRPGSTSFYGKNSPIGRGGLDAPSFEDFANTPGTGLPRFGS